MLWGRKTMPMDADHPQTYQLFSRGEDDLVRECPYCHHMSRPNVVAGETHGMRLMLAEFHVHFEKPGPSYTSQWAIQVVLLVGLRVQRGNPQLSRESASFPGGLSVHSWLLEGQESTQSPMIQNMPRLVLISNKQLNPLRSPWSSNSLFSDKRLLGDPTQVCHR